jgi:hypothetical protein
MVGPQNRDYREWKNATNIRRRVPRSSAFGAGQKCCFTCSRAIRKRNRRQDELPKRSSGLGELQFGSLPFGRQQELRSDQERSIHVREGLDRCRISRAQGACGQAGNDLAIAASVQQTLRMGGAVFSPAHTHLICANHPSLALASSAEAAINRGEGRLAQLAERLLYTQDVGGSSPSPPTKVRFVG